MISQALKAFFIFAFILLTFAANANELEAGICVNCTSTTKKSSAQELAQFGCNAETMTQECQTWFKENPSDIKYAKDCGKPDSEKPTWWQACKDAGIENWSEILNLLTHSANAIEACDNNMDCKVKLAKDAFFVCKNKDGSNQYPCTDTKQLAEVYAGDLARKRDKVRTLALQDKSYREQIEKWGYEMPKGAGKVMDFSPSVLKEIAEAKMKELGVKYSCYNSVGYVHMACYAIASVVDPTIIAAAPGVAIKGGKWASLALKARASAKATNAVEVVEVFDIAKLNASIANSSEKLGFTPKVTEHIYTTDNTDLDVMGLVYNPRNVRLENKRLFIEGKEWHKSTVNDPKTGKEIGSIETEIDPSGTNLGIRFIDIKPDYKQKGLSEVLLMDYLSKHPKVKKISSELGMDNYSVYKEARDKGLPCFDAIKLTPAYKIRAKAGFSKITKSNCLFKEGHMEFTVSKP